jgi:hypothetical protein
MKTKILLGLMALLAATHLAAQRITDIRFAYFKQAAKEETGSDILALGHYRGREVDAGSVSENPATKANILQLLKQLKANGTEDINKCFFPRHVVTVYSQDTVLYRVLVCFECDGIRFSNQVQTTKVRSVAKREKAMKGLKALFAQYHFNEKGTAE